MEWKNTAWVPLTPGSLSTIRAGVHREGGRGPLAAPAAAVPSGLKFDEGAPRRVLAGAELSDARAPDTAITSGAHWLSSPRRSPRVVVLLPDVTFDARSLAHDVRREFAARARPSRVDGGPSPPAARLDPRARSRLPTTRASASSRWTWARPRSRRSS